MTDPAGRADRAPNPPTADRGPDRTSDPSTGGDDEPSTRPSGLRNPAAAVRATGAVALSLEAVVVLFALAPIAHMGSGLSAPKLAALLGVVVLLIVAAGTLGRGWGWWLGGGCQVLVIASGFLTAAMFLLGGVFGLIWVAILRFRHTVESGR